MPITSRRAQAYIALVIVAGAGLVVGLAANLPRVDRVEGLLVFFVFTVVGEFKPIRAVVGRKSERGMEFTISSTFGLAILLRFGVGWAALALAGAAIVSDLLHHKSWWKVCFNAAQYVVTVCVAGLIWRLTSGESAMVDSTSFTSTRAILAAAAVAVAFFVTNVVVLAIAMALAHGDSMRRVLSTDFAYQFALHVVPLLSLSPAAVVIEQQSIWLLPSLMLPLAVAYRSTVVSLDKEHDATHDVLTGLPNRYNFHAAVAREIRNATEMRLAGVVLLDLDRFKSINDNLGHGTGDRVLCEVGGRIRAVLRDRDVVARLGGDEFGVVLVGLESEQEARTVAGRILESIEQPIEIDGLDLNVGASLGVALVTGQGTDADRLLERADVAMYAAKAASMGPVVYSQSLDYTSPMRVALVAQLRHAIRDGEIEVRYQPRVSLNDGALVGAEALIRWQHPVRGEILPHDFLPLAEQTGLIRDLTRHVLEVALLQRKRWHDSGIIVPVTVNLSAGAMHDRDLAPRLAALLDAHGGAGGGLIFDVGESTLASDFDRLLPAMQALVALGAEFALESFGTGNLALSRLLRLPLSELKVHESLVTDTMPGTPTAELCNSVAYLARRLGLRSAAVGVERPPTWAMLADMGYGVAQGFYCGRPMDAASLLGLLQGQRAA